MPDTEFTATTELAKWRMLSTEEIHEKFFEFASMNSTWVSDLYDIKDDDKNEAVICLAMIAGGSQVYQLVTFGGNR